MMNLMRMLTGLLLASLLAACGGGGGSAGATGGNGGGAGPGTTPATPKIALNIVTAAGVATTTVTTATPTFARAVLTDPAGAKLANTVVTFSSGSNALVKFVPSTGTALTDANGVATVEVQPASATAAGAGMLTASATVSGATVSATSSFQVPQTTSDSPSARVADFALFLDRTSLANGSSATARLNVIAVDASNNVVPGATVVVSTDKNSVFVPNGTVTDSAGVFTGQIGFGADKSNRTITATVIVNNKTKTTSIDVTGSKVTLQSVPSTPSPSQAAAVTATVTDSAGNPIPGVAVTLGGTVPALQSQVITTDATGVATKAYLAPSVAGVYTISGTGNGVSSGAYQLQVFSSTVPNAVVPAGAVPSLSASPNVLAVNTPGSTTNRSSLRFLFLDSSNTPIQNVRVRFEDVTTGLPAVGSSITTGGSVVYTDTSGTATAQYIPGPNSSPTNGVSIRACYKATDFTSSTDCPNSVNASLTVAGQALAVSIGDDNLLQKGSGTYIKEFAITVADSAGRAVPNAAVDISVDLTHFGKGEFGFPLSLPPQSLLAAYPLDTAAMPSAADGRVWCANEDTNRNGSVDIGENINGSTDSNGQPTLEPRKADLLVSYANPAVTTTNASGILLVKVEYSQRFATWLAYRIRATANVSGSQGMAERTFVTKYVESDLKDGSFLIPPYGFESCRSPD